MILDFDLDPYIHADSGKLEELLSPEALTGEDLLGHRQMDEVYQQLSPLQEQVRQSRTISNYRYHVYSPVFSQRHKLSHRPSPLSSPSRLPSRLPSPRLAPPLASPIPSFPSQNGVTWFSFLFQPHNLNDPTFDEQPKVAAEEQEEALVTTTTDRKQRRKLSRRGRRLASPIAVKGGVITKPNETRQEAIRRIKNNQASRDCRGRRRSRYELGMARIDELNEDNTTLRQKIADVEEVVRTLREGLISHGKNR